VTTGRHGIVFKLTPTSTADGVSAFSRPPSVHPELILGDLVVDKTEKTYSTTRNISLNHFDHGGTTPVILAYATSWPMCSLL
jgi:hypothetical protein